MTTLNKKELEVIEKIAKLDNELGCFSKKKITLQSSIRIKVLRKIEDADERMALLQIWLGEARQRNCEYPELDQEREIDDFFEEAEAKREAWVY